MTIPYTAGGDPRRLAVEAQRLADDLALIAAGRGPSAAQLSDAPVLADWSLATRPRAALAGFASGHPLLGDRRVVTSELFVFSVNGDWVRTWSRFYRLAPASLDLGRTL